MKPRILMFGWEFPPFNSGGLGVACQGLTKSLAERGFDILFVMPKRLSVSSPYARFVFAEHDGVATIAFDSSLSPYVSTKTYVRQTGPGEIYGRDLFAEVDRYRAAGGEIAREHPCDVIYAHDWLSFGAGIEAKRATGKPFIAHVHATEIDRCGGESSVNRHVFEIERRGMQEADCVIAVSEFTKNIIVEKYGIPAEKVRVVYNGIDESTAPGSAMSQRLRHIKERGYKVVLYLGRITLQKGPDYLLKAAKRVLERDPNVMFVFSGSGDMEGEMMRLAAVLGISQNVLFTGFLTGAERTEMYTAADLFVMPSVSEPFGITPLEAMRLGTPVMISKQSGVSEVVSHALKVDFWDVDEMANKILSVLEHPALGLTLRDYARHEAKRLTWADAAFKLDTIVHEVVR